MAIRIKEVFAPFAGAGSLRMCQLLLATVASIIVARQLGPAAYGQVSFVIAVMSLLSIPSSAALTPLLIREVSRHTSAGDSPTLSGFLAWSGSATLKTSVITAALVLAAVTLSQFLFPDDYTSLFAIAVTLIFLWAGTARVSGILQGLNRVVLGLSFEWLVVPIAYLLLVLLLWNFNALSAQSVLASTATSLLLGYVIGYVVLLRVFPERSRLRCDDERDSWIASWRSFSAIQALNVANLRAPILLIGVLSVEEEVGIYRVADNIASLLSVALIVANSVIGPKLASLYAAGELDDLRRLAKNTARVVLALCVPVALFAVVEGEWLIASLFGAEYTSGYPVLVLLVLAQVMSVATGSVGLFMNMTGHETDAVRMLGVALLVNLVLCLILIPLYGVVGAAIAVAVATILWNLLLHIKVRGILGTGVSVL